MEKFQSFQKSRFHVHILPTNKFRTRHLSMKIACPLERESVTASAILPYLWMEGTVNHPTALDIVRYADSLFGSILQTSVSKRGGLRVLDVSALIPEESGISGASGLFEKISELAVEVFTNPVRGEHGFSSVHVEREKGLHRKRIESVYDDKIAFAMERCMEIMCEGLPQGMPRLGYMDDIDSLTDVRLWDIYQKAISASEFHVYCVGQFDAPEDVANSLFALLQQAVPQADVKTHAQNVHAIEVRSGETRTVTDAQPVNQGKLDLGFRTGISYDSEDYVPLLVCNGIFGGFPHSKLFMNVREKASLAYYASSRLDALTGIVAVQTGIDTKHYEQALEIIKQQVKAIQSGEITEDELTFTARGLKNQYQQLLDQPNSLAEVHFNGVLANVERDTTDLLAWIDKVSKEDVVRVSQSLALDTVYFLKGEEVAANA